MVQLTPYNTGTKNIKCPSCGQNGTFYGHTSVSDIRIDHNKKSTIGGIRFCPNSSCNEVVFFSIVTNQKTGEVSDLDIYPKILIDFNNQDIPENIVSTFKEALTCHSQSCYKAAGTMIRRTLEEICFDCKCEGKDLHSRLEKLKEKIVIPKELLDAAFALKLLGNDAAHIEAKTYNEIGKEEIELAILLTKELLKSTYQYKGLLEQLESFKKKNTS